MGTLSLSLVHWEYMAALKCYCFNLLHVTEALIILRETFTSESCLLLEMHETFPAKMFL